MSTERLCPFLSSVEPQVCVGDRCQLWVTQRRELTDGRIDDFSNCVIVVSFVTQQRQLTEQIRTTATVDGVKETFMEAPRMIVSALARHRVLP